MLAISTMHDHNFHGGPILPSDSPPHPRMNASQELMNPDHFKYPSNFEPHVPSQQHVHFPQQSHGRYSLVPLQRQTDQPVQYDVSNSKHDARQTLSFPPAWEYNAVQQPQHQSHLVVNERGEHMSERVLMNDHKGREPFSKAHELFSKPVMSYSNNHHINDIDFEDVDEDDISDQEEEEELRRSYELYRQQLQRPDVTSRLLIFADVISSELKKYFGRTKEQEDSCDVYEDKWATTKSGRELYYADLLRIAQGDMEPASKTVQKTSPSSAASSSSFASSSPSSSPKPDADNRSNFKGVRDVNIGMGPLTELFEYGMKNILTDKRGASSTGTKPKEKLQKDSSKRSMFQERADNQDGSSVVPMQDRNLPDSFWKEPGTVISSSCLDSHRLEMMQQMGMLSSSRLPDFSDLVESWQGNVEGMETDHGSQRLNIPIEQNRF